jgi:hypothetical protein
MKLLIIISNHTFDEKWSDNIKILNDYMKNNHVECDYCGISNEDNFHIYEDIIKFKYKIINTKPQLSKICDFITDYKSELDYDWYMKIRPEIKLLDNINFNMFSEDAINARARVYNGPRKIKYGMSVNGKTDGWFDVGDCFYADNEHGIILDDMFYVFHKNIIEKNGFDKLSPSAPTKQHEWVHSEIFNERHIKLNVISINLCFTRFNTFSGDINL